MNPLKLLEDPLRELLVFLHDKANFTYGWSIVVLTVIVRIIILPLFVTQYRSARRMQEIAPQLKQLQAKHKGDKRKQQEEMMRLFQEHKVNPFGSCLPMVVQIPVFIALYYVLRNFANNILPSSADQNLSFMWAFQDISEQFRHIGPRAIIIAVIYGVTQLLATEVSMATTPQTSDWQRKLFRVMPLFIVAGLFLYPNIPSGLVLYWMTTNLWTVGQGLITRSLVPKTQLPSFRRSSRAPSADEGGGGKAVKAGAGKPKPKPEQPKAAKPQATPQPRRVRRKKGGSRR